MGSAHVQEWCSEQQRVFEVVALTSADCCSKAACALETPGRDLRRGDVVQRPGSGGSRWKDDQGGGPGGGPVYVC